MEKSEVLQQELIAFLKRKKVMVILAGILAVILVVSIILMSLGVSKRKEGRKIETTIGASLEKVVEINDLSTFTAVYNGIATSMNSEKPEKVDYYVSYEAIVKAGIDFEKIKVKADSENKNVTITVPCTTITDITVDIATLEFIFYNPKTNTSSVTQAAYKLCESDVRDESKTQTAIIELAQKNAENIVRALVQPFVDQMETSYTLFVISEAAK